MQKSCEHYTTVAVTLRFLCAYGSCIPIAWITLHYFRFMKTGRVVACLLSDPTSSTHATCCVQQVREVDVMESGLYVNGQWSDAQTVVTNAVTRQTTHPVASRVVCVLLTRLPVGRSVWFATCPIARLNDLLCVHITQWITAVLLGFCAVFFSVVSVSSFVQYLSAFECANITGRLRRWWIWVLYAHQLNCLSLQVIAYLPANTRLQLLRRPVKPRWKSGSLYTCCSMIYRANVLCGSGYKPMCSGLSQQSVSVSPW